MIDREAWHAIQSMGLQRVGHNLVTELNWVYVYVNPNLQFLNKYKVADFVRNPIVINMFYILLYEDRLEYFMTLKTSDDIRWREITKTLLDKDIKRFWPSWEIWVKVNQMKITMCKEPVLFLSQ